jgi:hypothetical protein
VVIYDLNEVNKKGTLYYGGKKDNKNEDSSPVASTSDPEDVKSKEKICGLWQSSQRPAGLLPILDRQNGNHG